MLLSTSKKNGLLNREFFPYNIGARARSYRALLNKNKKLFPREQFLFAVFSKSFRKLECSNFLLNITFCTASAEAKKLCSWSAAETLNEVRNSRYARLLTSFCLSNYSIESLSIIFCKSRKYLSVNFNALICKHFNESTVLNSVFK